MANKRVIELTLAAGISLTALMAAFTPLSRAGPADFSARDVILAGFSERPAVPLKGGTRTVVETMLASAPPEAARTNGLDFRPTESGAPVLTLSSQQMDFALVPRIAAGEENGERGRTLGFRVTAEPATTGQRWWIVAGAERETYVVAPGSGLRDLNLAQVGGSAAVGDAHVGIAFEVTDGAYASIGYVQERRHFELGTRDWEEQDHFIGAAFRARW